MNVVIYARFSSHSQTEQSIEGQLKVCNEYAAANNYVVVGEYIDRAQSGILEKSLVASSLLRGNVFRHTSRQESVSFVKTRYMPAFLPRAS